MAMSTSFTGDDAAGADARRASLAREVRSGMTRRERQLVEILMLSVDGDCRRASALVAEHVEEFADDAVALTVVERWFAQREAS
jgi:hypothetical protein